MCATFYIIEFVFITDQVMAACESVSLSIALKSLSFPGNNATARWPDGSVAGWRIWASCKVRHPLHSFFHPVPSSAVSLCTYFCTYLISHLAAVRHLAAVPILAATN